MSYDTVRNGIVGIIAGQGLAESDDAIDFKDVPALQYNNTFILKAVAGEMGDNSETMSTHFYDDQEWELTVAYGRGGAASDTVYRDEMHRKRVDLIKAIDNPTNWTSYVRLQKYQAWEVQELDNYYVLVIRIRIIDQVNY